MSVVLKRGLSITKDKFLLKSDSEKYKMFMASLLLVDSLKLRIKTLEAELEKKNANKIE